MTPNAAAHAALQVAMASATSTTSTRPSTAPFSAPSTPSTTSDASADGPQSEDGSIQITKGSLGDGKRPLRRIPAELLALAIPDAQREAMSAAGAFLRQVDDRVAKAAGMTAVEARTLRAADAVGLQRGITAIGWLCGVLQPAATASVRRLEVRGFIARVPRDGGHTAHAALTLTPKGRGKLDLVRRLEAVAFGAAFEGTGTESREQLIAGLRELVVHGLAGVERALAKMEA